MPDIDWPEFRAASGKSRERMRNEIIKRYLPFVRQIATKIKRRLPSSVELEDLVQDGVFGLVKSIEAYDETRGWRFESFAQYRVRGAINDGIRNRDWVPRLVRIRHEHAPAMLSLSDTVANYFANREIIIADTIPAKNPINTDISDYLRGLSKEERRIIELYYVRGWTMKRIGNRIGLGESRISQIHSNIIKRLRAKLITEPIHRRTHVNTAGNHGRHEGIGPTTRRARRRRQ